MPRVGTLRRPSRVLAGLVMSALAAGFSGALSLGTAHAASGWFNQNATTPAIAGLVTAYDTTHHVVLAFDGAQTWTWTTTTRTWTMIPTAHTPTSSSGFFAMAFDSTRGKAVMLTGPYSIPGQPLPPATTWEWDGTDWTQLTPVHSPLARFGRSHSLAFDSKRGVTVLFSGQFNDPMLPGDTWEWNGTDWTDRSTAYAPVRRSGHCLAYDSTRGVTMLFGGTEDHGSGNSSLSDTWEYDGTSWTNLGYAGIGAGGFAVCDMVFDPVLGRMIDIATKAAQANTFVVEPYYWDGSSWVDTNFPGPSGYAAPAAYDVASDTVVLGLQPVPTGSPQTWLLNPPPLPTPGWVNQNVTAPSPVAMTYDSARHVMLALDGSKTWNYSTTSRTWTAIPTVNHPSAGGVNFAMTFDSARGKAVVVASPTPLGDPVTNFITTWEWDGTDWTQIVSAHNPLARSGFEQSLAYDAKRGVTVLFSGQFNGVPGDTWEWNGTDWTDRTTSTGPIGRQNQCLGYDTKRNVTVLYGGFENLGSSSITLTDTWEYDGTSWTQRASSGGPSSFNCSLTYDPALSRIIGLANKSVPPTNQALEPYYWDGVSWVDTLLPGPGEDGFTAAYDPGSDAVVVDLFPLTTGGPETWLFNPSPPPPPGGGGGSTPPVVTSVSPNHGPASGLTTVTVTGSGFTGADSMSFRAGEPVMKLCGQQPAGVGWCFTVDSDTQITALSPPLPLGTWDVYVNTPLGSSANSPADLFSAEGWDRPTPVDKTAFDVPIKHPARPQTFTLTLVEMGMAQIGHSTLPDWVVCTDTTNPATAPNTAAQVDCSVSPTGSGLFPVTFFDANDVNRVPTRTYIVGRGLYAGLGDSFASGDGSTSSYETGYGFDTSADGCHRSPVAYARLIGNELYGGNQPFVACAGAIIKDVYFGKNGEPRQLNALNEQVDLVTISIGGNDIGFSDIAKDCFIAVPIGQLPCEFFDDGPAHAGLQRIGAPGVPRTADGTPIVPDHNAGEHTAVFTLERLYAEIHAAAPNARIVVVGYPRLLPKIPFNPCVSLTPDEILWANHLTADLDNTVATSAARAGVEYVDVLEAFDGHEFCSPDVLHSDVVYPGFGTPLHPTAAGQAQLEGFVAGQVNSGPPGSLFLVKTHQKQITVAGVNPGSGSVSFQLSWPGSDIVTSLVSPSGRTIDRTTTAPDVVVNHGSNYEVITVSNPEAGPWTVGMYGADVSPDGENARLNVVQLAPYNQPPIAQLAASPAAGTAPLSVAFDGSGSSDPDGTVASYSWDFGDGTSGTGPTPTHLYSAPGQYAAELTVTDSGGRQGFAGAVIKVREGSRLVYTGSTRSDFNDPATLSARLTSTLTGKPLAGIALTFTAAGQTCGAVTDAAGSASCSIIPSAAAGPGQVVVVATATDRYAAATTSAVFTVAQEETRLTRPRSDGGPGQGGDFHGSQGTSVNLSAVLTTDGVALAGRTVTFTIGSGARAQSCQALTSVSGQAGCSLGLREDWNDRPLVATFAGDAFYAASSARAEGGGGDRRDEGGGDRR